MLFTEMENKGEGACLREKDEEINGLVTGTGEPLVSESENKCFKKICMTQKMNFKICLF